MVMLDISYIPKPSGRAKTPVRKFIDKTITAIGPQEFYAYHLTALAMEKYPDLTRTVISDTVQAALRQASEQGVIVREAVAGDAECVGVKYRYSGAKCPNQGCKDGIIPHQVGYHEWEPEQCQWCYEKEQALQGASRTMLLTKRQEKCASFT